MENFNSVNDILDFAIQAEQDAVEFYTKLSQHSSNSQMQQVFSDFAHEEMGHKARLLEIKETGILETSHEKVMDMKMADYIAHANISPDMTYADALVVAMKKEKAAFKLYLALSQRMQDPKMKELFLSLAQEESKHKLRFELEYDENVLKEN